MLRHLWVQSGGDHTKCVPELGVASFHLDGPFETTHGSFQEFLAGLAVAERESAVFSPTKVVPGYCLCVDVVS